MSSNYQVSNSCTPSTTYFGNSYNNRNSEHDTSTSQVFVDDRIIVEDSMAPILVRILVVDDEPDINLVIRIMLERQKGFRVNSFDDPDLGKATIQAHGNSI